MKNGFYYGLLLMLSFTVLSSSCSSDDEENSSVDNAEQINQIEITIESGTWRITSFIDSSQDETSDFNGYNFMFNSDNSLVASNGTNTVTGTWSITNDSNSSSSGDDIDFNIFFPVPDTNDFEDLNDDWDIVSRSSTRIELIDISGGGGGTDTLVFQKN